MRFSPAQDDRRDRIALRLLCDYGIRKGALQVIQFKHFDHERRRLTIFTKGRKVRELPITDRAFRMDLEHHILDVEAQAQDFLMARVNGNGAVKVVIPSKPMSAHVLGGIRRLEAAQIVPKGTTRGEKMHKSRHTAGQRVLDATGNPQGGPEAAGHSSIQTTGDVYSDWDIDQLTETMADVIAADQIVPAELFESPANSYFMETVGTTSAKPPAYSSISTGACYPIATRLAASQAGLSIPPCHGTAVDRHAGVRTARSRMPSRICFAIRLSCRGSAASRPDSSTTRSLSASVATN